MLKFFRQYNKYILVVGGTILMVAFLIQPALDIFIPSPGDRPVGMIDGETLTYEDQAAAAAELHLLSQIPMLAQLGTDDPLHWMLMLHEARQMGLSASDSEVQQLVQMLGIDDLTLARILQQLRAAEGFVDQTFRHWLMVQKYRELLLGQAHSPVTLRLSTLASAQQYFQQGNFFGGVTMMNMAYGSPRISEPLIRRFLYDQYATVNGETTLIEHDRYLDQVEAPTQAQLEELFNEYREALPGEGEPYGFGYRTPARVKIEYLTIPIDQVTPQVTLEEADLLDFYEQNRESFAESAGGEPQPYAEVRSRIREQMRRQRADTLAQEMARAARNAMLEHQATRQLPEDGGYRRMPDDFQPLSLEAAADAVEQAYGVRPRVQRGADEWLAVTDVASLPGLGGGTLAGRDDVAVQDYIMSAREMQPAVDNPLLPLRLQVGLPSALVRSWDGSYHLFRLVDAAPARSPESLDEVRQQVEEDARRLAAYRLLLEDQARWVNQAREQGLEELASEIGEAVLNVPATPRSAGFAGAGQSPTIPGLGQADSLLAAMFDVGQELAQAADQTDGAGAIASVPADQRIGVAPLDHRLSLAVFRLEGFQPMPRADYEAMATDPRIGSAVSQSLRSTGPAAATEDPLAFDAIARRVGFVAEDDPSGS